MTLRTTMITSTLGRIGTLWLALGAVATASEPADALPLAGDTPSTVLEGPMELVTAENTVVLDGLTSRDYKYLKPRRHLLPANPYAQTDFTAYTLEFGEVKLGLASITMGIAPRVQLGTVPLLDAAGIYNVNLKANPVRFGPVDLSALGSAYYLPLGEFQGLYLGGGGMASVKLSRGVSLHGGAEYRHLFARGVPTRLPLLISSFMDTTQVEATLANISTAIASPTVSADLVTVRAALDIRLNRRDSIVIQGQAITWARGHADLGLLSQAVAPTLVGTDDSVLGGEQTLNIADAYMVTASWQLAFKQVDVRVGGGAAAVPWVWALQANDVSYRFGGSTRREDTRRKKGWKTNRKDVMGTRAYEVDVVYDESALEHEDQPLVDLSEAASSPEETPQAEPDTAP